MQNVECKMARRTPCVFTALCVALRAINPNNHSNPKNQSSDNNPNNHSNPKNQSSDNGGVAWELGIKN
jgi:hypothetical protein